MAGGRRSRPATASTRARGGTPRWPVSWKRGRPGGRGCRSRAHGRASVQLAHPQTCSRSRRSAISPVREDQMSTVLTPTLIATTMTTPIGPLTMVAFDEQVVAGGFTEDIALLTARLSPELRAAPPEPVADLGPISDALIAYFAGDVGALDRIAVSPRGGPFQRRVWEALRATPPGQPTTYRDIAIHLGGRQLARAVGTANATNPIAPIIPCHRLVGSDGRLRGYFWALDRKRWLLDHEQRHARGVPLVPAGQATGQVT